MLNPRTGCNWLQLVFLHVGCRWSGCEWSRSGLSRNLSEGQPVAVPVASKKEKRLDQTGLSNTTPYVAHTMYCPHHVSPTALCVCRVKAQGRLVKVQGRLGDVACTEPKE